MAKFSGKDFSLLLVDGYNLASGITEQAVVNQESLTETTQPFGTSAEETTPINLEKGILTAGGGFYDPAVDAIHTALSAVTGISRVLCAGLFGNTIGKPFFGFEGPYSQKYEVMARRDGLTQANVSYLLSGAIEPGVIVQDLATFTATWDTKTGGANATDAPVDNTLDTIQRVVAITSSSIANPSVITCPKPHGLTTGQKVLIAGHSGSTPSINGIQTATVTGTNTFTIAVNVTAGGTGGTVVPASTVNGGSAYLHCTAYSGFTNVVVKVMHSPDDITYAALVTFATLTAVGKERKTVTGTVDRYLSSQGTVTGSGSITVFTGFCRG